VQGAVVPVVSHVKETDIVSTETDDDFFDDESFDEISENDRPEEPSSLVRDLEEEPRRISKQQKGEVPPGGKVSTTRAGTSAGILSPPDILQGPHALRQAVEDLGRSTESLRTVREDLEVYDQEPGARKPKGGTRGTVSKDKVKEQDDDETSAAYAQYDDSVGKSKQVPASKSERIPEDDEVAQINSKAEVKRGTKKTKKSKKADSKMEAEETIGLVPGELGGASEGVAKKTKSKQKKKTTKKLDLEEEFKPLASSEMFESAPSTSEHFKPLHLQNDMSGSSEIVGGSAEVVGELPKRTAKRKDEKKRKQLSKNPELVSELQKRFQLGQDFQDEQPEDDVSYSNSLDIVIPPIESKWKNLHDQSTDNSLDVSIPALDVKYFQMGKDADADSKWQPVKNHGAKPGVVNLDDIIIPRPSDLGDDDFYGQDVQKGERVVGRRQQRLTKQGLPSAGTKEMGKIPETNLDDLSYDQESSRTFDDESKDDDESTTGWTRKTKTRGVVGKKWEDEEDEETRSLDSKSIDPSIDESMDVLPPEALTDKPSVTVLSKKVVRPPKPQKPRNLSAGPTKEEETLPASSKPTPFKRQVQPIPKGTASAGGGWRSFSTGAEVVEVQSSGEEGYRPVTTEPIGMRRGAQMGQVLPRFPPTAIGGQCVHMHACMCWGT